MGGGVLDWLDAAARETTLFAAIWFLAGGLDDLAVDVLHLIRCARGRAGPTVLPDAPAPGRIAVFVPAWDESAVIGAMLRQALIRWPGDGYRIYVGTYPNDPATIREVAAVAETDSRVRLVIGGRPGPTTKADCLNHLWRALLRDELVEGQGDELVEGQAALGVALHDAEDLVHPRELELYARALTSHHAVQLPVIPLVCGDSHWISGHYCDEFAEAHGKALPVREALGAGLPFAGVGCAVARAMLGRIAAARGGSPFDDSSLTEDYELGLTVSRLGGRTLFARVPEEPGGPPVAVRAYFPRDFDAAVRQKARWMAGIAFAGWDRTGWGRARDLGDHWMRMRDRRATLAMPVLAVAYAALVIWACAFAGHLIGGRPTPGLAPGMQWLIVANMALLVWRVAVRVHFVQATYGWRQAVRAPGRMLVANIVALAAARRAALIYLKTLTGAVPQWDKTAHHFPDAPEQA